MRSKPTNRKAVRSSRIRKNFDVRHENPMCVGTVDFKNIPTNWTKL